MASRKPTLKSSLKKLDRLYRETKEKTAELRKKSLLHPEQLSEIKKEIARITASNAILGNQIGMSIPPVKIELSTGLHYPSLGSSGKEKFRIRLRRVYLADMMIEADSKEQAEEIARQRYFNCEVPMRREHKRIESTGDFRIINPTTKQKWKGKWLEELKEYEEDALAVQQAIDDNNKKNKRWEKKKTEIQERRSKKRFWINKNKTKEEEK